MGQIKVVARCCESAVKHFHGSCTSIPQALRQTSQLLALAPGDELYHQLVVSIFGEAGRGRLQTSGL